MLTAIKPLLRQTLNAIGVDAVYTESEDETKIKGLKYAWVFGADPERVVRDGNTIVVSDGRYYLKEYELRLKVGIRIAAKDEPGVAAIKTDFLNALAISPTVKDARGFDIEVAVILAELIGDKSVLKNGCGYEIVVELTGGVYRPAELTEVDPWLKTISEWTAALLGQPWRSYEFYPVGRPDATLYWQITSVDVEENGLAMFVVRKKMTARIFANGDQSTRAAVKIVEGLQFDYKIPLDAPAKKYLTVSKPEANLRNDPATGSQITVTLMRNTKRPTEEFPLMGRFYPGGKLQEV